MERASPSIQGLMENTSNIRHVIILGAVDHGKSTIRDNLYRKASLRLSDSTKTHEISSPNSGIPPRFDHHMLYFEHRASMEGSNPSYLINVVNSPQYLGGLELSSAMNISDGAFYVVDCVEGPASTSGQFLAQALHHKIKPLLVINKVDRLFLELKSDQEEIYHTFVRILDGVNSVLYSHEQMDMGNLEFDPVLGNVAFGSARDDWAFTISTFARLYSQKFNLEVKKLEIKLWGDNYYDIEARTWIDSSKAADSSCRRSFCMFILNPIAKLHSSLMDSDDQQIDKILTSLNIKLNADDRKLKGKQLIKAVMSAWINMTDTLLEMAALHLPSPRAAQKYRCTYLYEGPQDDEVAASIRDCNPKGPLIMYVSRMVPAEDNKSFYAFGRVFGGSVQSGQKVKILGPRYVLGDETDLFVKAIDGIMLKNGSTREIIQSASCGNIIELSGIDRFLTKTGTITDIDAKGSPIKTPVYSKFPMINVKVEPKKASELPKLVEDLTRIAKSEQNIAVFVEENGSLILSAPHESIIIECLNEVTSCEVVISDPFTNYRETVTTKSDKICSSTSPNKQTSISVSAEPLHEEFGELIDALKNGMGDSLTEKQKLLSEKFEWDSSKLSSIWSFGIYSQTSSILVNETKGMDFPNEIRASIRATFESVSREGALAGECLNSVKMSIFGATWQPDGLLKGSGEIVKRAFYGAQLAAKPTLQEPIYLVRITAVKDARSEVYLHLERRRATILEETLEEYSGKTVIKAYMPVSESFGN